MRIDPKAKEEVEEYERDVDEAREEMRFINCLMGMCPRFCPDRKRCSGRDGWC